MLRTYSCICWLLPTYSCIYQMLRKHMYVYLSCGWGTMVPQFLTHGGSPSLGRLKLCFISSVQMRKWPGGFPRHIPGGLRSVWEVPGLAGEMRCNKQIRMQQSTASGAAHLVRFGCFCSTHYICRNVSALIHLP